MIEEGTRLVTDAMLRSPLGPWQLRAAIASLHIQAPQAVDTDWQQISFLYQVQCRIAPNPIATLNHAIDVAMTDGPDAGLAPRSAPTKRTRNHAASRAKCRSPWACIMSLRRA